MRRFKALSWPFLWLAGTAYALTDLALTGVAGYLARGDLAEIDAWLASEDIVPAELQSAYEVGPR